ncbi:unnamed protein product [Rotaria sordida]|uniref:Uncharacterized protein n=1 Tax=Rotaria sordida TaxID=392033 RepID=A0A815LCW7_9BILA|nr:unnamed protein product [Rotaria sordida]CAF1624877.1 unnamed protein product [Rotaria sordida]
MISIFWGNDTWPGNSPDLNVAEHIGTVIKNEVEQKMLSEIEQNRYKEETLKKHLLSDHLIQQSSDHQSEPSQQNQQKLNPLLLEHSLACEIYIYLQH